MTLETRDAVVSCVRTAAWYAERSVTLRFPAQWDVIEHWPPTLPPLGEEQIRTSIGRPFGQGPIHERCRGEKRPVVVVDDLNRPAPAWRVMPHVLEEFRRGDIDPAAITIVMATGTHGAPRPGALETKVGRQAAAACRLEAHDAGRGGGRLGKTSYGTPVLANRTVAASDFVLGIGGIYPNHTAGFGGGAKLALGVLAKSSISRLHYQHGSVGWGTVDGPNHFRRDLDAIAELMGLHTMISLHVDHRGEIVRLACGDHLRYFAEEEILTAVQAEPGPGPEVARGPVSLRAAAVDRSLSRTGPLTLSRSRAGNEIEWR